MLEKVCDEYRIVREVMLAKVGSFANEVSHVLKLR